MYHFSLVVLALFALSGIVARRKSFLLLNLNPNLRDCLTSVEGDWTWVTNDGRSYENVEIEKIEGDEIVLKHEFGVSRLLISSLSHEALRRLYSTSFWHNHDHDETGSGSEIDLPGMHPEHVNAEENLKAV